MLLFGQYDTCLRPREVRVPKIMLRLSEDQIELWKMLKTTSKILFLAWVMIFRKSQFPRNYSTHLNLNLWCTRKLLLCTFLRKQPIQRYWKLGYYVYTFLWWISTDLVWGFEKFYFFRILWAKICRYSPKEGINPMKFLNF